MSAASAIDPARQEAFVHKVLDHASGTMTTLLAVIGDRLVLVKTLAEDGPATSRDLARVDDPPGDGMPLRECDRPVPRWRDVLLAKRRRHG